MKRLLASILISTIVIFGIPLNAPVVQTDIAGKFSQMFMTQDACAAWIFKNFSGGSKAAVFSTVPFESYLDITYYHNCNALGNATKSSGSATVTYDVGILLETSSPILGTGSWDNNNDGEDDVSIPISGNFDLNNGAIGFYIKPNELADGRVFFCDTYTDFACVYEGVGTAIIRVYYKGSSARIYNTDSIQVGVISYLSFKFSGGTCTVYLDGVERGSVSGSTEITSTNLHFFSYGANAWDSNIDQIIASNDSKRNIYEIRNKTNF